MSTYFEKFGGTYHEENGYLIPDLTVPETPKIGAWGQTLSAPSENIKTRALYGAGVLRKARRASERDRTLRRGNAGSSYDADGRTGKRHRAAESNESDGVG